MFAKYLFYCIAAICITHFQTAVKAFETTETANIEPSAPTDIRSLANLTSDQMFLLNDQEAAAYYAIRMSNSDDSSSWIAIIDGDIASRPRSGSIILGLLKKPQNRFIRPGLWYWLSLHPKYKDTNVLLAESVALFRSEGAGWKWQERGSFAQFWLFGKVKS